MPTRALLTLWVLPKLSPESLASPGRVQGGAPGNPRGTTAERALLGRKSVGGQCFQDACFVGTEIRIVGSRAGTQACRAHGHLLAPDRSPLGRQLVWMSQLPRSQCDSFWLLQDGYMARKTLLLTGFELQPPGCLKIALPSLVQWTRL